MVGELSEDNRTYRNNLLPVRSRDSSVSIINTLQAGRSRNYGQILGRSKDLLLSTVSTSPGTSIHPLTQGTRLRFQRAKLTECETND